MYGFLSFLPTYLQGVYIYIFICICVYILTYMAITFSVASNLPFFPPSRFPHLIITAHGYHIVADFVFTSLSCSPSSSRIAASSAPRPLLLLRIQKLALLHPPRLEPLRQLGIALGQIPDRDALHVDVELEAALPGYAVQAQALPDRGRFAELVVVLICDCHVVDGFDVLGLPEVLHRCHEAFGSRVQQVFWEGAVVFETPFPCLSGFFWCVACCFAEADKPYTTQTSASSHCRRRLAKSLTSRPLPLCDARKHAIQLGLVLGPFPRHHGHAHAPDSPSEQRHPA